MKADSFRSGAAGGRRLRRALGLVAIVASFGYLLAVRVEGGELVRALERCEPLRLAPVAAAQAAFVVLGGTGIWLLLAGRVPLAFASLFRAYVRSVVVGLWTPAGAGEMSLAWFLRSESVPLSLGFAAAALDKLVTVSVLALLAVPVLGRVSAVADSLAAVPHPGLLVLLPAGAVAGALLFVSLRARRAIAARWREPLRAVRAVASPARISANAAITLLRSIAGTAALWWSLEALGALVDVSFLGLVALASAARLLALGLASPGGLGVYELVLVESLAPGQVAAATVLAAALLARGVGLVVVAVAVAAVAPFREGAGPSHVPRLRSTGERPVGDDVASFDEWMLVMRQRFAYHAATEGLPTGARVLDVGAGEGSGTAVLVAEGLDAFALEIDPAAARHAARHVLRCRAPVVVGDGRELPFRPGSFDAVVSFQAVEHVEDDHAFATELARVVAPEGTAILTTPNRALRLRAGERPWNRFHRREYDAEDLRGLLEIAFASVEVLGVDATPELRALEHDRLRRIRRLADLDRWRLVQRLPARFVTALRALARRIRWAARRDDRRRFAQRCAVTDFRISADPATSLDLLAVCRGPRTAP